MTDQMRAPGSVDFSRLGFVDAPLVPPAPPGGEAHWVRLVGNAAANRLLAACIRARAQARPVLVTMTEEIPEYYYRVAQNDFLARAAAEPDLGIMALNIPLEMMRLGRIRGTLAELAELVVAVDFPVTMGAWFANALDVVESALPEAALVTTEEVEEARRLFLEDPHAAVDRYFAFDARVLAAAEMDVVVHEAYLRQVGQPVEVAQEDEPADGAADDPTEMRNVAAGSPEEEAPASPDAHMREYLLALARVRLSPVLARAFAAFGHYGDSLAAQELKITKAPRKTLASLLRFMSARWSNIVVIYDSFDAWPMLDQKARVDVLASLTELRYIIGETGVMVVGVADGVAPEIAEQFAGAEQVDWSLAEIHELSRGETGSAVERVQSWLDAAALDGASRLKSDGPELAPLLEASAGDLSAFAAMAAAALRDAAGRGLSAPDATSVAAALDLRRDGAGL